jgi:hypothetical protein
MVLVNVPRKILSNRMLLMPRCPIARTVVSAPSLLNSNDIAHSVQIAIKVRKSDRD